MPHLAGLHCGVQGQVLGVTIDVFSPSVGYMEPSGTVKDGHMEKSPGRFEIDLFFLCSVVKVTTLFSNGVLPYSHPMVDN